MSVFLKLVSVINRFLLALCLALGLAPSEANGPDLQLFGEAEDKE